MEPHRRLPSARSALHGEKLVQWRADDLVLLGLDRGDDVEHLAGTRPFELGQQGIAAPESGGTGHLFAAVEDVVGDGSDRVAVHHDLAPPHETQRLAWTGSIEGHRHRRPPVDDHRVGPDVLDVATPDVPRPADLFVDAAEQEGTRAVGQERDPTRECRDVVEIGIARGDEILQQRLRPHPHRRQ